MGGGKSTYGTINTANPTGQYRIYKQAGRYNTANGGNFSREMSLRNVGAYGRRAAPQLKEMFGNGTFGRSQTRATVRPSPIRGRASVTFGPSVPIRNGSNNSRLVRAMTRAQSRQIAGGDIYRHS